MNSKTTPSKSKKITTFVRSILRELIMLILGILLALQIDSWAEERGDRAEIKTDLEYVLEDLRNNKIGLKQIKLEKESSNQLCTELIDGYKLGKSIDDDRIVETLSSIFIPNNFDDERGGFARVRASSLYESREFADVRSKVRIYNDRLLELRISENYINSYISSLSIEMSKHGSLLKVFDYIRMKQGVAQYKAPLPKFEIVEILDDNKSLQAALHKYEFDVVRLIKNYDKLMIAVDDLTSTANEYLAN